MLSTTIETILAGNKTLAPRGKTDKYFLLAPGSFGYRGYLDDAIRYIEQKQLLDAPLFAKFVRVFTEEPKLDPRDLGWRGEYWGKMMRGGCITYAYTQDPELYRVLSDTAKDMIAAAEEDGRISSYTRETEFDGWDMWARKYVMLGLLYFVEICHEEELAAKALYTAKREADTILAAVGEGEGKKEITKTARMWAGVASSSVLEPIMRIYHLTGEKKYLDFASYIVRSGGSSVQNIFEDAYRDELPLCRYKVLKAYEIISCFEGLLEYYRATGIEKWRIAAVNLGRRIREEELSIIGSAGCWHELFDHTVTRQLATHYADVMQETCVTVTYLKFSLQLLCLTGDAAIADTMERAIYNALLGAVNKEDDQKNGGLPFDSYSPLLMNARGRFVGGKVILSDGSFYGCCACIGSAGTGLIPAASALLSPDGVVMNLYLPGTVATQTPDGAPLELEIQTEYPKDGAVSLTVATNEEKPFTIALRIPAWSRRTVLAVNGQLQSAEPGTYRELRRVWHSGDRIDLYLDMRTEILTPPEEPLPDENSRYHMALRRGPLILARDSRLTGDIRTPVHFKETEKGYADVRLADAPDFPVNFSFAAKQTDGTELPLVDYASAGRTFDANSLVCAWMPTKNYYAFDLSKPFRLTACCRYKNEKVGTETRAPLALREGFLCCVGKPIGEPVFTAVPQKDGSVLIETGGRFLSVNEEGNVVLSDKGDRFTVGFEGLNRIHIRTADGRYLAVKVNSRGELPVYAKPGTTPRPQNLFEVSAPDEKTF